MIGAGSWWRLRPSGVFDWQQLNAVPGEDPALAELYVEACDALEEDCAFPPRFYNLGDLLSPLEVDRQTQTYRAGSAQSQEGVIVRNQDYIRYENWSDTDPH
ncbi:MAG: hypothetical protein ACKV22_41545 [Bryobacteraceae bacterium]